MDCFGVAIINGMAPDTLRPGTKLKVALSFAMAHYIMIFAGFYLGATVDFIVKDVDHWLAFIIISFIGLKMIVASIKINPMTKAFDINNIKVILALSVATSIDALIVGVSISFLNFSVGLSALILAVVVFLVSFAGINTGKKFGFRFGKRVGIMGGGLLIGIAVFNLLSYLL